MQAKQTQDIERIARKRAGAKLGWYIHAGVYIAVNLMLALIAASAGRNWAIFPAAGWAVGLAIHGVVVFFVTGGGGLHDRLVQQERERLQLQRDPW
jgi:hypothetical protein